MLVPRCRPLTLHLLLQNDYNEDIDEELKNPSDQRVFAIANAFHQGRTVDEIHALTNIDKWFLRKLEHITDMEKIVACAFLRSWEIGRASCRERVS